MNDPEFLPDAVQWSEGMLLSPQHFQQYDIHLQALVNQRLASLSPNVWGVRRLRLDAARLADGYVKISECDAVMPDGLPLVFRTGPERSLSLDLASRCSADGRSVRVFLAIPPRAGALDVPTTSIRRYETVVGRKTLDETTGIGDVVVERQRVQIGLYAEGDVPAGYPALPLLDLVRDANGSVVLRDYHPPMFRLGASAFLGTRGLHQRLLNLRERMWAKLRELIGTCGEDDQEALAMIGSEARMHLRVARELAACLPVVDTVLADPLCPPDAAWRALAMIVGRMTAVGGLPRPLTMEPYRHLDCIPQFQAAIEFIDGRLAMIDTRWDSMAFARVAEGIFARRLPEDSPAKVHIELRPREGQTARELHAWLAEARIASENLLPILRQRRLPGARWRVLGAREVADLGLRADAMICELTSQHLELADHGIVESFRAGQSMVIQGESGHAPAVIVLHHPKGGRSEVQRSARESDHHHA